MKVDPKTVLIDLAKLGRSQRIHRSDVRKAAFGHPQSKVRGGLGYVTTLLNEDLLGRGWLERVARDHYRITELGWQQIG
jgi:hypothetical protein